MAAASAGAGERSLTGGYLGVRGGAGSKMSGGMRRGSQNLPGGNRWRGGCSGGGGLPQSKVVAQRDQPPPDYFPNPSTRSPPDLPPRLETLLFYATSLNRFSYILHTHVMQIYINVYNVWAELVIIYYIYTRHYILYIHRHNIIYIHYTRIYTILYIHI